MRQFCQIERALIEKKSKQLAKLEAAVNLVDASADLAQFSLREKNSEFTHKQAKAVTIMEWDQLRRSFFFFHSLLVFVWSHIVHRKHFGRPDLLAKSLSDFDNMSWGDVASSGNTVDLSTQIQVEGETQGGGGGGEELLESKGTSEEADQLKSTPKKPSIVNAERSPPLSASASAIRRDSRVTQNSEPYVAGENQDELNRLRKESDFDEEDDQVEESGGMDVFEDVAEEADPAEEMFRDNLGSEADSKSPVFRMAFAIEQIFSQSLPCRESLSNTATNATGIKSSSDYPYLITS